MSQQKNILTSERPTNQPVKDNNKWYREHKDEPAVREAFRASARKFYAKNREDEKLRSLTRYYAKKGLPVPAVRRIYTRKEKPPAEEVVKN